MQTLRLSWTGAGTQQDEDSAGAVDFETLTVHRILVLDENGSPVMVVGGGGESYLKAEGYSNAEYLGEDNQTGLWVSAPLAPLSERTNTNPPGRYGALVCQEEKVLLLLKMYESTTVPSSASTTVRMGVDQDNAEVGASSYRGTAVLNCNSGGFPSLALNSVFSNSAGLPGDTLNELVLGGVPSSLTGVDESIGLSIGLQDVLEQSSGKATHTKLLYYLTRDGAIHGEWASPEGERHQVAGD